MKKTLMSLMLAFSLIVGETSAIACEPIIPIKSLDLNYQTLKVADIIYEYGCYWLVTEKDKRGGKWVVDWVFGEKLNPQKLAEYKKSLVGKKIEVVFYDNNEFVTWYFVE
jgi:hypothetical protein